MSWTQTLNPRATPKANKLVREVPRIYFLLRLHQAGGTEKVTPRGKERRMGTTGGGEKWLKR